MPAWASADSVFVRVEATSGALVPFSTITLPSSSVVPAGALDGQTCPGNSVVGAIDTATSGNWSGTWSDTSGWSVDKIKGVNSTAGTGKHWAILVDNQYLNTAPCQTPLSDKDSVLIYPMCDTSQAGCFPNGILEIAAVVPSLVFLDSSYRWQALEVKTTFSAGNGTSTTSPSVGAAFSWPNTYTYTTNNPTDPIAGTALLAFHQAGDNPITLTKPGFAPDRADTCVTNGSDGNCGTTVPTPNPFDPAAFCPYTGDNGYCGSVDKTAPVGHITSPAQGHAFPTGAGPTKLNGTVDFDPSLVDHVDLRLMRALKVTVKKVTKRRVWVTRKVHGKRVRKRVIKRKTRKVKQTVCYGWNTNTSDFARLKKCDPARAKLFQADGADTWSTEFLRALPNGAYTLDALAQDGAGNTDSAMEVGRNRVTFTVK